jgi:hypothetical protein
LLFGFFGLPLVAGSLWLIVLGFRCWRPTGSLCFVLRVTHVITLSVGCLLCIYGVFALEAAARSDAAGGGLLGGFGLLPLGLGIALGVVGLAGLYLSTKT